MGARGGGDLLCGFAGRRRAEGERTGVWEEERGGIAGMAEGMGGTVKRLLKKEVVRRPRSSQAFGVGGTVRRVSRARWSEEESRGVESCASRGNRMGGILL